MDTTTQPETGQALPLGLDDRKPEKTFFRSLLASGVLHALLFLLLAGFGESLLFAFMQNSGGNGEQGAPGLFVGTVSLEQLAPQTAPPQETALPKEAPLPEQSAVPVKTPAKAQPKALAAKEASPPKPAKTTAPPKTPVNGGEQQSPPQATTPEPTALGQAPKDGLNNQGSQGTEGPLGNKDSSIVSTSFLDANGPRFVKVPTPEYPEIARHKGIEGQVLLELVIDDTGDLLSVRVKESAGPYLDKAAQSAVRKARFAPATRNGKPVRCIALLPVPFILTR